jgi:hypothetical protein
MSETTPAAAVETTTVAVTPDAPAAAVAEAPQAVQPETTAEQPFETTAVGPAAKRAVKEAVMKAASERAKAAAFGRTDAPAATTEAQPDAATPVVDGRGRAHDPSTGQFLPAGEAATGEQPAASPSETRPDAAATAAADEVPAGHVRIPIPEHLQRHFGSEKIVPESDAEFVRWNLNNAIRAAELQDIRQQTARRLDAVETENLQLRAALEARVAWQEGDVSPQVMRHYHELLEQDPEVAKSYLQGELLKVEQQAEAKFGEYEKQRVEQQEEAEGRRFVADAFDWVRERIQPEIANSSLYTSLFEEARQEYAMRVRLAVERGQRPTLDREQFYADFRAAALRNPAVVNFLQNQRDARRTAEQERLNAEAAQREQKAREEAAQQARAEAAEKERQALQQIATRPPPNPAGEIPGSVRTDRVSTTPATEDLSSLPIHEQRRILKGESRQVARSLQAR